MPLHWLLTQGPAGCDCECGLRFSVRRWLQSRQRQARQKRPERALGQRWKASELAQLLCLGGMQHCLLPLGAELAAGLAAPLVAELAAELEAELAPGKKQVRPWQQQLVPGQSLAVALLLVCHGQPAPRWRLSRSPLSHWAGETSLGWLQSSFSAARIPWELCPLFPNSRCVTTAGTSRALTEGGASPAGPCAREACLE